MKLKSKFQISFLNKYDLLVVLLIATAVLIIMTIWIWYGHKNQELEREIYKLK